jgi:hypothetical protein
MARYAMVHQAKQFVAGVYEWDGGYEQWVPPPGYDMVLDVPPPGEEATYQWANAGMLYEDGKFIAVPGGSPGTAYGGEAPS